jgi:hypothetical protein
MLITVQLPPKKHNTISNRLSQNSLLYQSQRTRLRKMSWKPTPAPVTTQDTLDIPILRKHTALIQNLYFPALLPMNQNKRTLTSYDLRRTTLYEHTGMSALVLVGQYTARHLYPYNWAQLFSATPPRYLMTIHRRCLLKAETADQNTDTRDPSQRKTYSAMLLVHLTSTTEKHHIKNMADTVQRRSLYTYTPKEMLLREPPRRCIHFRALTDNTQEISALHRAY